MMVGVEVLLISLLMAIFSNEAIYSSIYLCLSLVCAISYFICYKKEYKKLDQLEKEKLKSQFSYKLIIVSLMIVTINFVYPLGIINLILGYCLLLYFIVLFAYRLIKKDILKKRHFMNYNYLFDLYSIACLGMIFWDVLNYAI